jgi:hypothetical protein
MMFNICWSRDVARFAGSVDLRGHGFPRARLCEPWVTSKDNCSELRSSDPCLMMEIRPIDLLHSLIFQERMVAGSAAPDKFINLNPRLAEPRLGLSYFRCSAAR